MSGLSMREPRVDVPLDIVTFEPSGAHAEVPRGTTLREAAARAGEPLEAPCGGLGVCGRCAVAAAGALQEPTEDEAVLLSPQRLTAGVRLACRARVAGDVTVRREAAAAPETLRIVEEGSAIAPVVEPPERRGIRGAGRLLGAVADIGTTTVVVAVVDLRTGEQVGSASALNPQQVFGHDVISRITHAGIRGVESLREPIVTAIEDLVLRVLAGAGEAVDALREIAICGNTTMVHLFLGIDPAPLGVAPYEPAFLSPVDRPAREIGLRRLPYAGAYVLPGVSAFIGSDVTAGVLATRIAERDRPTILLDLGTNGEIVLRTPDGLVAASTAAGPALEGASIAYGMRAEDGAIERTDVDGDGLRLTTIGDVAPRGLCGSGLLDLVAALLSVGVLDPSGRLRDDTPHPLTSRVSDREGVRVFEVAPDVLLTQLDVRQVQLAKAAIASGIGLLLDSAGVSAADVTEVIVAGGFGYHVKASALVGIGMIPPEWADRVRFAGNAAKEGTMLALLDSDVRRRAEAIASHVTTVGLASRADFQVRFMGAIDFPPRG
jgi:uncharacterized 2Fe-2S/4Fe-4S cluster protein (DUF4445 family)